MKKMIKTAAGAAIALLATGAALADITIGVVLPLTGPASGLGIPVGNQMKLWPATIGGEKIKLIVLDDATDPTNGTKIAKRFVTEDKVDVIIGSVATPVAIPMAAVAAESGTVQLALSPMGLPPGKDAWTFRLAQSNAVMSHAVVGLMKKQGIKTVGFLGYTDAYGEGWLKDFTAEAEKNGIKIVATERFARSDSSVTGQVLKLVAANPDAMLIVASGSGAAMPHMAVVDRGYKGKIYQTHAAATRDPSKPIAIDFVQKYEKVYGVGSRNQFGGHGYDAELVLEKAIPIALKKAKPGTPEFRAALRDALETMGRTVVSQGVLNWTKDDHWGFTPETGVMLKVVNGDWKVE